MVSPKITLILFHCSHFVRPCRLAAQLSYSFHPNSLSHNIPDVETLIISPTRYTYSSSQCYKSVCCLPLRPCIKFNFFPHFKVINTVGPCCTYLLLPNHILSIQGGTYYVDLTWGVPLLFEPWFLSQGYIFLPRSLLSKGMFLTKYSLANKIFSEYPAPPPIESSSLSLSTYRWQAQCDLATLLPRYICYINSERNWWNIHLWVTSL